MTEQEFFYTRMALLADVCQTQLSQELVALYDRALAPHGHARAAAVMEQFLMTRRSRDAFPSVAEMLERLGVVEISDEAKAEEATSRILTALSRHGHVWHDTATAWPDEAIDELGQLAWEVVKRWGGWSQVCQIEEVEIARAQLRRLALAVLAQARAGSLETPPGLPGPTGQNLVPQALPESGQKVPRGTISCDSNENVTKHCHHCHQIKS